MSKQRLSPAQYKRDSYPSLQPEDKTQNFINDAKIMDMWMSGPNLPAKLLQRIVDTSDDPKCIALCPDFELGAWRYKSLAEHIFDWLPDVALRPQEREALLYEPRKTLAHCCRRLFDTKDPSKRGEVGEVLLHAACRQEFGTAPFVARLFYKMRTNDSVTSVDVVHVLYNQDDKKLELWLGEAKLYDDVKSARYKALDSIKPLWNNEFLKEMKALIGPKIGESSPHEKELGWLFSDETSLDEIVSRLVIPVCIVADFDPTKAATTRNDAYIAAVHEELKAARDYLNERIPAEVRFVVIFIPMDCKEKLETAVNDQVQMYL